VTEKRLARKEVWGGRGGAHQTEKPEQGGKGNPLLWKRVLDDDEGARRGGASRPGTIQKKTRNAGESRAGT